jgi:hypothetical protein
MDFDRFFDDGGFLDTCDDFLRDMLKAVVREMIEDWEQADAITETISHDEGGFVWIFERFADKIKERTFDAWEVARNKESPYCPVAIKPRKRDLRDLFEIALKEAAEDIIPLIQTNFYLISRKTEELKKERETRVRMEHSPLRFPHEKETVKKLNKPSLEMGFSGPGTRKTWWRRH